MVPLRRTCGCIPASGLTAGKPKFGMCEVLDRVAQAADPSASQPAKVEDFGSPFWPSRVVPETGDAHSEDPTCA